MRAAARAVSQQLAAARMAALHYRDVVLPLWTSIVEQSQRQYNAMQIERVPAGAAAKRAQLAAQQKYVLALRDYWLQRSAAEQLVAGSLPLRRPPLNVQRGAVRAMQQAGGPARSEESDAHATQADRLGGRDLGGVARGTRAGAQPRKRGEAAARMGARANAAQAGAAGVTPVETPNGATLPWKLVDGVKVYHLVAEPVEHEFCPGSKRVLGLQRPHARADDRGRRGRPRAHLRHQPAARADDRALARRAACRTAWTASAA